MKKMKKPNLNSNYIVGFTDGEGTFNLVRYPDGRIRPQFLLFNTDKEILNKIKQTLKLSCPIFEVSRISDVIKRRKKCYRPQARSIKDIEKLIKFFDRHSSVIKKKIINYSKKHIINGFLLLNRNI